MTEMKLSPPHMFNRQAVFRLPIPLERPESPWFKKYKVLTFKYHIDLTNEKLSA